MTAWRWLAPARAGRRIARVLGLAAVLVVLAPGAAAAQDIRTAVSPDTVTVGDVARAAIRVDLPAGYRAVLPEGLDLEGELEAAGPRSLWREPREDGGERVTAAYPLATWRPGTTELPPVAVRISGPDGERTVEVPLPPLEVRSVLPADAAEVEPRPLKDVLGANRALWPFLLLAGLVLLTAAAWLWRRRRGGTVPAVATEPDLPPREAALGILDRAMAARLVETGRMKAFYSEIATAVRLYLDALDPRWGADLTTSELADRLGADVPPTDRDGVLRVLAAADMVKFARRHAPPEQARIDWEVARAWVETFEHPAAAETAADGTAAVAAAGDGDGRRPPVARDGVGPSFDRPTSRRGGAGLAGAGSGGGAAPGAPGTAGDERPDGREMRTP